MAKLLRNLPSMSELLESPQLKSLMNRVSQSEVVARARRALDELSSQVQSAAANVHVPAPAELAQKIADWIAVDGATAIVPVINATGVVVPELLGRAPLAEEAIEALARASRGYANVDFDLATGEQRGRTAHLARNLAQLTGAEAATVVNNQAAAITITLATLARGREVLVSRGQLGESASGERLASLVAASGAVLREVGAANRTRGDDFSSSLTDRTAAIVYAAAADYEVGGLREQPTLAEVVGIGRRHNVPVIDVSASGALIDFYRYGLRGQSLVSESMRSGAALVLFSGDKLLGGPECGIIAGRRNLIEALEGHDLYRAVQVDKLRLAALSATLRLLADTDLAERTIPLVSFLSTSVENLRQRAGRIAPQVVATGIADVAVLEGSSYVLGSPLEDQKLPTVVLALAPKTGTAQQLAARLRCGATPVISRVEADRVLLDLRSVPPRDDMALVAAFEALREPISRSAPTEIPITPSAEE